jgi:hypothetical protein
MTGGGVKQNNFLEIGYGGEVGCPDFLDGEN